MKREGPPTVVVSPGEVALVIRLRQNQETLGNVTAGFCSRANTGDRLGAAIDEPGNCGIAKTSDREVGQQLLDAPVGERCCIHHTIPCHAVTRCEWKPPCHYTILLGFDAGNFTAEAYLTVLR